MERWLTILEVSQKQAYIFGSKRVEDNIVNSAVIAKCLSPNYIGVVLKENYSESSNLVYSGGGHTILEFDSQDNAKKCVSILTSNIYKVFDGLEVFAKTVKYDEALTPKDNLKNLTAQLERKKAIRKSGFHQGSYGIEQIDVNTLKPKAEMENDSKKQIKTEEYNDSSKLFTPAGYLPTSKFENLGGEKNSSNFIAVVHIDGNGMGKRVDELYESLDNNTDWETVKKNLRDFSENIDADFKAAYREMTDEVAKSLENGRLKDRLNLKKGKDEGEYKYYFPIRRIITAGDDICFVAEGRIGIECARIFIEKLSGKTNKTDKKGYAACAGVAIVHQKYPFYRAYELSELLCSNAKKSGAKLSPNDDGRNICSIDWHIEFGEIKDSIEEIRNEYIADDGSIITQKPYVVNADKSVLNTLPKERRYDYFANKEAEILKCIKDYGNSKLKTLRGIMKQGVVETDNYLDFYGLKSNIGNPMFDAIEVMDTFLFV